MLANAQVTEHLVKSRYKPVAQTPSVCKNKERNINFSLYVDDFLIKYTSDQDTEHLLETLKIKYAVSTDWEVKTVFWSILKMGV